jgi:cyclic pyranopterin phosphate synthase
MNSIARSVVKFGHMLCDRFGRPINYLRISVTDRCNLRCAYCMPPEGIRLFDHSQIMRYEEIAAFARIAAQAGIREIRLTGGEPLARLGLPDLVAMLSAIPGIEDISLTSNGLLLEKYAGALKQAGLKRVNISLDSLRPKRYDRITRGGSFEQAWRGILAAEAAGLTPIKLNAVAIRGFNDDELADLANLAREHPWQVRFIEFMPLSDTQECGWGPDLPDPRRAFMPIHEVKDRLSGLQLSPAAGSAGSGPAREYTFPGALGRVGFISPLSQHFCQECNRVRLTADGYLRLCLLSDLEIPILPALRRGEDLLPLLEQAVGMKPSGHELVQNQRPLNRCMTQIGG